MRIQTLRFAYVESRRFVGYLIPVLEVIYISLRRDMTCDTAIFISLGSPTPSVVGSIAVLCALKLRHSIYDRAVTHENALAQRGALMTLVEIQHPLTIFRAFLRVRFGWIDYAYRCDYSACFCEPKLQLLEVVEEMFTLKISFKGC